YGDCDASTTSPTLTVNDFICFLNKFAAGDTYANCDGSAVPPVLNVNDFICYINVFAAGCS
ncbi:MAG: GC-type dockerin domain-anchored protein, partial [Phycisphaerales bacterium]